MRLSEIWKNKFPNTCRFLASELVKEAAANSNIWSAFLDVSGFNKDSAVNVISENSDGPLVWFLPLNIRTGGIFDPKVPGRISLSSDIAAEFEASPNNATAKQFFLITTLHEICHWAWHKQRKNDSDTAGEEFERKAGVSPNYGWLSVVRGSSQTANERAMALKNSLTSGIALKPSIEIFDGSDIAQGMGRGIRNNNPGNIRIGDPWIGLSERSMMTDFQKTESSFCVFCEPEWGLRAMAIILRKYQDKYSLSTPFEIINKWAPPEDNNDVTSYASSVANAIGVSINQKIDLKDKSVMISLLKAMGKHENGVKLPYSDTQFEASLILAS